MSTQPWARTVDSPLRLSSTSPANSILLRAPSPGIITGLSRARTFLNGIRCAGVATAASTKSSRPSRSTSCAISMGMRPRVLPSPACSAVFKAGAICISPLSVRTTAKSKPSTVTVLNTASCRRKPDHLGSSTIRLARASDWPAAPGTTTSVNTTCRNPTCTSPTWLRGPSRLETRCSTIRTAANARIAASAISISSTARVVPKAERWRDAGASGFMNNPE
ncbi:hypothetical protein D3C73_960240 [compost metagenome]